MDKNEKTLSTLRYYYGTEIQITNYSNEIEIFLLKGMEESPLDIRYRHNVFIFDGLLKFITNNKETHIRQMSHVHSIIIKHKTNKNEKDFALVG